MITAENEICSIIHWSNKLRGSVVVKAIDETGNKYSRWFVLSKASMDKRGEQLFNCVCDCGTKKIVTGGKLRSGWSKSCGCMKRELSARRLTTHNKSSSKEYRTYKNMINRCYRKDDKSFKNYGGRGIKVCDRWLESFEKFYEDVGDIPKSMTLERIDNDGEYSPQNTKISTTAEQSLNKRNTFFVHYRNKVQPLMNVSREVGIKYSTLRRRIVVQGLTADEAVEYKKWAK